MDLQQQIDIRTKYSKKLDQKTEIHEDSNSFRPIFKIKCLKPIYFSQHHKEAKIFI